MKIDITSSKIVTLSANNTFRRIISRILTIWQRIFSGQYVNENNMWEALKRNDLFAELIATVSAKGIGDFYQEINSVAENGGYINKTIIDKNTFRLGAMGDQPSGVRAGYILLKATDGVHENALAGYLAETNSVMISR